jgi:hypothetical protein
MDDALLNCMTGVCCPPVAQAAALARWMVAEGLCAEPYATTISQRLVKEFDFAEAGTLAPLRKSIVRLHKAKA